MLLYTMIYSKIFGVTVPAHYAVLSQRFSGEALFDDIISNNGPTF